jgi:hypothetical protein
MSAQHVRAVHSDTAESRGKLGQKSGEETRAIVKSRGGGIATGGGGFENGSAYPAGDRLKKLSGLVRALLVGALGPGGLRSSMASIYERWTLASLRILPTAAGRSGATTSAMTLSCCVALRLSQAVLQPARLPA